MATGAPDWQGLQWKVEATNRPTQLYPSGRVMLADDFSEPNVSWQITGAGGTTATLVTTPTYTPPNALKIVNGGAVGVEAYARKWIGVPRTDKIGVELAYSKITAQDITLRIRCTVYDGTNSHRATVQHSTSTGYWEYYNSAGGYTKVPGSDEKLYLDDDTFHRVKLVFDTSIDEYVALFSNQHFYDMTGTNMYTTASAINEIAVVAIGSVPLAAGAKTLYVDNVTITEE